MLGMRERRTGRKAPCACRSTETPALVPVPTRSLPLRGHGHGGTVAPSVCQSWDQAGLPAHTAGGGEQNFAGQEMPVHSISKEAGFAPGAGMARHGSCLLSGTDLQRCRGSRCPQAARTAGMPSLGAAAERA